MSGILVRTESTQFFEVNCRNSTSVSQAYAVFAISLGNIAWHKIFCSADFMARTVSSSRLESCALPGQSVQTSTKSITEMWLRSLYDLCCIACTSPVTRHLPVTIKIKDLNAVSAMKLPHSMTAEKTFARNASPRCLTNLAHSWVAREGSV